MSKQAGWKRALDQHDNAGWEPEYDDEPRTDGNSALDQFCESCRTADNERRKWWPDGIILLRDLEREGLNRFRKEWVNTVTHKLWSPMR